MAAAVAPAVEPPAALAAFPSAYSSSAECEGAAMVPSSEKHPPPAAAFESSIFSTTAPQRGSDLSPLPPAAAGISAMSTAADDDDGALSHRDAAEEPDAKRPRVDTFGINDSTNGGFC